MNAADIVAFVVDLLNKILAALGVDYVIDVAPKAEDEEVVA